MARLPIPAQDNGTWGDVLNDFLSQSLDSAGALRSDIVGTTNLQSNAVDSSVITDGAITQAKVKVRNLATDLAAKALKATTISAGSGLTGGGDLSANRSLAVSFGATAGTEAQGNDARKTGAIQSTASDDTIYTTLGWRFLTLNSVIPAQGTGRFVRVYRAVNSYSGLPNTFYVQIGTGSNTPLLGGYNVPNHRRTVYTNGEASWPASFNPLTFGILTEYVPLIGLG